MLYIYILVNLKTTMLCLWGIKVRCVKSVN